jgi:hypothetical protein
MCAVINEESNYEFSTHSSLPAIRSKNCTQQGTVVSPDRGLQCVFCHDLRKARGNSNPREFVKRLYPNFQKGMERRSKKELTKGDVEDAKWWKYQQPTRFTPEGRQLHQEAICQIEYQSTVSNIIAKLAIEQPIKISTPGAVMGPRQFMENFTIRKCCPLKDCYYFHILDVFTHFMILSQSS